MLIRGPLRYCILLLLILLAIFTFTDYLDSAPVNWLSKSQETKSAYTSSEITQSHSGKDLFSVASTDTEQSTENVSIDQSIYTDVENVYRKVFSVSTKDQKYFRIQFKGNQAYNPNIIPHKTMNDTWYIVAQQQDFSVTWSYWFAEWVCIAQFQDGELRCVKEISILPIGPTYGNKCFGDLENLGLGVGPHDARVFYGPDRPYIMFGSNSIYACYGQWFQDFRVLVDWGGEPQTPVEDFKFAVDIQRPDEYGIMEKNFFVFWDFDGNMYTHYDIAPKRVFSKLHKDGSVGEDLALQAKTDDKCMAQYMPRTTGELESIHQATNSLSISFCKRSDPNCVPDVSNTYIFTIFHHKSYYSYHSNYEPYVMVFRQVEPFSIYGISKKPFWINGRGMPGQGEKPTWLGANDEWTQSEMMYMTSISWKAQSQKYHGYIDDVLFINFGIEDSRTAAIDIKAESLFLDLGLCSDLEK